MSIKLKGSSDGSVSFDAPADTSPSGSDITLVLPTTVGSAEQFLKNSGTAGTLEFSSMVETSTGVGIGTSSPGEKLTVAGKIQATTEFKSESGNDLRLNAGSANRDVFMQVNGSTLMTIQGSTGNVGIGPVSPDRQLHVKNATDTAQVKVETTASSGRAQVQYASPHGDWVQGIQGATTSGDFLTYTAGSKNILWFTAGSERMRIDSSGHLNLVSSSSGLTDLNFTASDLSVYARVAGGKTGSGVGDLRFYTYSGGLSESMRIDSSGRLLLGTTTEGVTNADTFTLATSGHAGITIRTGASHDGQIAFSDGTSGVAEYQGQILYNHSSNFMRFQTGANERMRIDSSGRLLVGTSTSPSAGSGQYAKIVSTGNTSAATGDGRLMLGRGQAATSMSSGQDIGSVLFTDNTGATFAAISSNVDGTPGSGDYPARLGFATTSDGASSPTERMQIDSSGVVSINQTSASNIFRIQSSGSNESNMLFQNSTSGTGAGNGLYVGIDGSANGYLWNYENLPLIFATNNSEAMRIDNAGKILFACTSSSGTSDPGVKLSQANNPWLRIVGNESTGTNFFLSGYNTNSTNNGYRFYVMFNGGIANYSGNNSNLSDEREKKNIVSLDSKWDKVKSWELKKFHYNEDADTDDLRYGVIAQQVEEHCPEVLSDWVKQSAEDAVLDGDGNVVTPAVPEVVRKGVKEQQMMWMAIKALQEAQARIETLEAKVAALEAQ